MRGVAARAALVALGLLIGLAVLEGVLQVASWAARPRVTAYGRGARRVLAVGDSNVFGVYVDRSEAYPAQLEGFLPGATVVNAGVPGMSSTRLARLLPMLLEEHQPTDVLITVGANDFWAVLPDAINRPWWARLRLARFAYLAAWYLRTADRRESVDYARSQTMIFDTRSQTMIVDDAMVDVTPRVRQAGDPDPETVRHVAAMVGIVRAAGARPWIVTYASPHPIYRVGSDLLRQGADGAPVIDVTLADDGMFFPDRHPNATGYTEIARRVAAALAAR